MRRLLIIPLAGISLTMLAYLWPAGDPEAVLLDDDPEPTASAQSNGHQAELHRLIHQPAVISPIPAAALTMDFHGVVKNSVSGAILSEVDVEWALAVKGECQDEEVDWKTASVAQDGTFTVARSEVQGPGELCLDLELDDHVTRRFSVAQGRWPAGRPGLVARLDPYGKIRGRVFDLAGKPLADTDVSAALGDSREAQEDTTTDGKGWYELPGLEPGRYLVMADAEYERLANFEEVQLKAGEVRRLDLREREVPRISLRGKVVDSSGRGVTRVVVKIEPRVKARGGRERYFLVQSAGNTTWRDGSFEVDLGRAGWYRVRLYAQQNATQVMGQADLYASGGKGEESTIVYKGKVTTCTLHDASGRQVSLSGGYSMIISRGCTSMGMGVIGGLGRSPVHRDLRFPWPPNARSVSVTLDGQGLSGGISLTGPDDVCMIKGHSPTGQ